ncbi:MAG TPA: hypothetical protein VFD24_05920 [Chitinophagaceae bacterium]|jgi:hypothetical protein|nr:hypothetical protein [Chitinophagaceae bacterium]
MLFDPAPKKDLFLFADAVMDYPKPIPGCSGILSLIKYFLQLSVLRMAKPAANHPFN